MGDQRLPSQRFRALVRQLRADGNTDEQIAVLLGGIHRTNVSKVMRARNPRDVGVDLLMRACEGLKLRCEYFFDESLGPAPDFRAFVGPRRSAAAHMEPHPVIEHYIDQHVTDAAVAHELRRLSIALDADAITPEVLTGLHRGLEARDARRRLEGPISSGPNLRTQVRRKR